MYKSIATKLIVAKLSSLIIRHELQTLPEDTAHSSDVNEDGRTLNLLVMRQGNTKIDGLWLSGIMGMNATDINSIVDRTYGNIHAHLAKHYNYVLVREDGYYDSLGFIVLADYGVRRSLNLRDYLRLCIHNAFRDMYRNVGFNLIIENDKVVGLKHINMKDAELELYVHYKHARDELGGYDHDQTNVYPFKRIRNRLKLFKEK